MRRRAALAVPVALVLAAALLAGGCGGHDSGRSSTDVPVAQPSTAAPSVSASATTATSSTRPPVPAGALVAQAIGPRVTIYAQPNAGAHAQSFPNPWQVDPSRPKSLVPQVFLVETQRADGWDEVLLPVRPNGSVGWVRATEVTVRSVAYHVRVELGAHRITVLNGNAVVYQGPVAVGAPATPTPTGHYYIRVLIKAPSPNTVYGPYAYGLSSHSDALSTFNGGDAEIGLHGNNDASVLGHDVTHGCIRMDNAEIATLSTLLPLGTPVDIQA